jgi:hypothetical protein
MRFPPLFFAASLSLTFFPLAFSQNVRLTNDVSGGYISAYTIATGISYTDPVLTECSISRGRQNEPAVAVDPRNTSVLIGSSNDYCGVYDATINGVPAAVGPIWLGYYRSENGGASFQSSLVPGYPGDQSPYAALAQIRTASSGDPVVAWDAHGRVFMGSESSDDPSGSKKTFGDVWVATFDNPGGENGTTLNDGKRFVRSAIVQRGSSAPTAFRTKPPLKPTAPEAAATPTSTSPGQASTAITAPTKSISLAPPTTELAGRTTQSSARACNLSRTLTSPSLATATSMSLIAPSQKPTANRTPCTT